MDALELEAGMLIELLIEKIILYDDRVEIYYKTHNEAENPDEASEVSRDFSLNGTKIKITRKGILCDLLGVFWQNNFGYLLNKIN